MKIKAILLAAGNSTRFKENKLLSEVNGKKMIFYPLQLLKDCEIESIVVSQYEKILELVNEYGFRYIYNDKPNLGISYSIQLGLNNLDDCDGVIFLVADQPFLKSKTLIKMIEKTDDKHIVRCSTKTRKGNPVYFPKCFFNEIKSLKGDVGGKQVIINHLDCIQEILCDEEELIDIDTYEDKMKFI